MKPSKIASAIALGAALTIGSAGFALADVPANSPVWSMDVNKDKKVTKEEYLAYWAKMFDKAAGSKGYCTYEEVQKYFENPYSG
mgnify:CR=1 FL=1|jgi:hypothetical protein